MKSYNTIVVGAGASGLMAAGRAAELGSSVLLLEKNKRPGIKLLMTGGGRCNFANNSDLRELIKSYGTEGPFLFSGNFQERFFQALSTFGKLFLPAVGQLPYLWPEQYWLIFPLRPENGQWYQPHHWYGG